MANPDPLTTQLSRRERQIMDVVYRVGKVTAAEVLAELPDPPSYSAVRAMLRLLEDKGHVRHEQDGPRYVYLPTVNRDKARKSAMKHLVRTFFDGSTEDAVAALLQNDAGMNDDELERLSKLIDSAKKEGR
jgi:predicted transcriptional regulator